MSVRMAGENLRVDGAKALSGKLRPETVKQFANLTARLHFAISSLQGPFRRNISSEIQLISMP